MTKNSEIDSELAQPATATTTTPTKRKPITCDADCRNAKPEAKKYSRTCQEGMSFWVHPNGRKHFSYRYSRPGLGVQNSIAIGDYGDGALSLKDAKAIRNQYNQLLAAGIDPSEQRKAEKEAAQPAVTLASITRAYLEKESPTHAGHRWELLRLNKLMGDFPALFALPVTDLHQRHMIELRDIRAELVSGSSVNRELKLLGGVFRYAIRELHVMTDSPLKDVRRCKESPHRERRITQDEIDRICTACKYHPEQPPILHKQQTAWAFLFAIETAMRASEICGMTWEHVHPDHVHLPKTKNGDSRNVPLSLAARALLEQVRGLDADRVLTVDADSMCSLFYTAKEAAGFTKDDNLHFHDSRHEATTRLAKIIQNPADLAKITGHKDLKKLMIYYNPTASELAERLAQGQAAQGNVIAFKKPASA